jgi:hypothetical protein
MLQLTIGTILALFCLNTQLAQDSLAVRAFPVCVTAEGYYTINGWDAKFQFRRIPGLKATAQDRDIDYGVRFYYIQTDHGRQGIQHGAGPLWSFGRPLDSDVKKSVKYEEVTYNADGQTITDARGQFSNGTHWRYLGKFGESARYADVDEVTAKLLDMVLDGACFRVSATKH